MMPNYLEFDVAIEQYMRYLTTRCRSSNTSYTYKLVLTQFRDYVGSQNVPVSKQVVDNFVNEIQKTKNLKPASLNLYVSALSAFYQYFVDTNRIVYNPVAHIHRKPVAQPSIPMADHDRIMDFINNSGCKYSALIRLMYATGIRLSEACSITVDQIDFCESSISINGKGGRDYVVFADAETMRQLSDRIGGKQSGYVFTGRGGKNHVSPRSVQHYFEKYAPDGITPHSLRHCFATEFYNNTRDIYLVQESLGHASPRTTELYVHRNLAERKYLYDTHNPIESSGRAHQSKLISS